MTTGDVKNNLRKLKTELRLIKYKEEIPWQQINVGLTEPLLPILHYVFGDYSYEFTSYLGAKGYDFFCKSDLRFIEIVFKILVTEFNLKPMLTKQQFFAVGFAEIKVIFVTKIISLCRTKNMAILAKLKKPRKQVQLKQSISLDCIAQRENTSKVDFHIEPNEYEIPIKIMEDPTSQGKCTPNDVLDLTTVDQISDNEVNNLVNTDYDDSISTVRDVLDLSEINGDDNIEKLIDDESQLFIDNNEDICGNHLPRFTILKHTLPEVRLVEESILNELDGEAKVKNKNEFTLESCTQCINNTKKMSVMENRISSLEKKFTASVKLNNELSAKIILLETKVNLLESSSKKREEEKDEIVGSTSMISAEKQITQPPLYSPLNYSDDDTIMKGFRPITMKDVRAAQGINSGHVDDKENHPHVVADPNELKCISTSSNRNVSFDSKTKETIFNVEKFFQDADQLLSARSSVERF